MGYKAQSHSASVIRTKERHGENKGGKKMGTVYQAVINRWNSVKATARTKEGLTCMLLGVCGGWVFAWFLQRLLH